MRETDIKGKKFGYLTAIEKSNKRDFFVFQCDCGNLVEKRKMDVVHGKTTNCGCMTSKILSEKFKKHGCSGTRLYWIWAAMKNRCYNKNFKGYKNYGSRGIVVCDEWKNNFKCFKDWSLKNGYLEGLSIERINVNGNYSPENCKWINLSDQPNNKRNTITLNFNGEESTLRDLCKKFGIKHSTALTRMRKGYCIDEIFSKENLFKRKAHLDMFTYNGETKCLAEWCRFFNTKYHTSWSRLFKYNKTFKETFDL